MTERPVGIPTSAPVVGEKVSARLTSGRRPRPAVTFLRASDALRCARRVGFGLFGTPADIPFTAQEKARFTEGDYVDATAAEVLARSRDARTQVPFHWLPTLPLGGKADAGYVDSQGRRVIVEAKSASHNAWARAVGLWDSVPPAPKPEWLVQGGLAALAPAMGADRVHIVLVDNETYDVAEWVLGVDDPLDGPDFPWVTHPETGEVSPPTIRTMVYAEVDRLVEIFARASKGTLPARVVPGYGLVAVPPDRDSRDEPWACRFCPWQPSCSRMDADAVADFGEVAA